MSTHDEYMTRRQARDLARRLARLERKTRSTAAAHADLRHSAIDGGRGLVLKDEHGNEAYRLGADENGVTAPQYRGGPTPEQPSEPFVDVGGEVVKIQHSGLDVNEAPAPGDFRRAQIHVSQAEAFEPSWSTLAGYLEESDGSFTHRLPGGEWWVGIVWETLSGKQSVMSGTVLADIPPLVDAQDIEDTLAAAEEKLNTYRDEVAAPLFQQLETGLAEHADNLADARDRLETAEQTLSPLPGQVSEARDFAEGAIEAAESAEARAVEASNNASNRLQNGGFELGLDHWTVSNVTLSSDAHTGNQAALIGVGGSLSPDASIPVSEGDVWDVSAFGKGGTALVVDVINSAGSSVLESFSTPMGSTWSETGRQRVEIPTGVDYMNIRITGDSTLVDDVVLRDVTDVVRLERAATQARLAADQALAELELMRLAVDGEGGLKDRLTTAETVLEDKADTSALNQLDEKLRGDISAIESYYSKIWPRSVNPPPSGVSYEWWGEPYNARSLRRLNGTVTAWNQYPNPTFRDTNNDGFPDGLVRYATGGNTGTYTVTDDGVRVESSLNSAGRFGIRANRLSKSSRDEVRVHFTADLADGHYVSVYMDQTLGGSYNGSSLQDVTTSGEHHVTLPLRDAADGISIAGLWLERGSGTSSGESSVTFHSIYIVPRGVESFDGDTLSDRAHDLWYNTDGVPHEWVNGEGWVAISDERIQQLADAVDSHADRLENAETTLQNKADTSDLTELDGVLRKAFGEADEAVTQAAALDAQQKATAAQQAAETEAGRLANAEAQAAQTEAIRQAAADALAKAEAARDEAISTSSDDAAAKAQAAREAAEAYAAAEAAAKADAAQAEAIRQAALDATEKADQAKTDAENAAKQYADQQDAQVRADAAADAQTKADAAKDAAEAAATAHAELVAQGAEDAAIAEAARLYDIAVAQAEAAQARAEEAHNEAGSAWSHADAAMNRAVTAESNAIAEARAELAALEVGARNLIKDSAPNITTSSYLVASFDLGDTPPAEGDTVTLSIKGQLGAGRTEWMVYNSGGSVRIQDLTLSTQDDDGVYRVTGAWRVGGSANTHIRVYAFPSSASSESTIEWIKLERGSKATDWQPAPEDIQARIDQAKEDAQAHADNLPKSLGGTTPPTGTAPDGSVWRQRDSSNTINARWERIDGAWVPQQVSGEVIDNLEAGKITALYTEFAESVINKVWAQLGVFDRLDAREGWVGGVHLENGAVTADKMTITGDMAAAIVSADEARISEILADTMWAELGVFDRLDAREGWVGGVHLEDGAVTAEKIEATREMITKLFGAEWAYIGERLVVDGDLIANHADVISAAIKNLSVTERADLFEAFITTLGAQEAVIDLLIGTEAWIGGTMLKDDTVTTRNIEFTEELVGNIAELLHLVVDRIDANALWADTAWLTAVEAANVRLRSTINDWQTILSGRGMEVISPEGQPTVQLGNFEETGLTLYRHDTSDDVNEATASITDDGAISGTVISANDEFYYQGTELSELLESGDHYPLGVLGDRSFSDTDWGPFTTQTGVGYLGFLAIPGRLYKITVSGTVRNTSTSGDIYMRLRASHTPSLAHGWPEPSVSADMVGDWHAVNIISNGWHSFTMVRTWHYPTHDLVAEKPTRILLTMAPISGSAEWRGGGQVIVEDMGLQPDTRSGWHRGGSSGSTPPEPTPIKTRRTSTFTMDWWRVWWQNGNIPSSGVGTKEVAQGRTPYFTTAGLYRSMVGFPSMTSTLSGADIEKIEVRVRVTHTHSGRGGRVRLGVHGLVNRPSNFAYNDLELTNTHFGRGAEKWVTLPSSTHAGFKNGTHRGIVTYSSSSSTDYYVQMNPSRFAIRITYRK